MKVSVFLIMFVSVVFLVLFIMYAIILPAYTVEWVGWVILPAAMIAGFTVATFTSSFLKIGVFLVGAWAGAMGASCLFQLFVYKITADSTLLWLMILVCAVVVGLLSLKFLRLVMIIGTSFAGAYLIIRGISFFLGGYPNEFDLWNEIQAGDIENVPWTLYVYVLAMITLTGLGFLFQSRKLNALTGDHKNRYFSIND